MRPRNFLILAVLLLPFCIQAGSYSFSLDDPKLKFSGVIDFSIGEVMKGKYRGVAGDAWDQDAAIKVDIPVSHAWLGNPLARLNLDFTPNDKIRMLLGFEGAAFLNELPLELGVKATANGGKPTFPQGMSWCVHQAQGIVSVLNNEKMSLDVSLGLMPYKYNPDVRNLGEFLFRSGTYPFLLFNNFNFPLARLTGLRASFKYGTKDIGLTVDQFILMEHDVAPLNDISIATIASVNVMKFIDLGLGVDFARVIPVNGTLTTPKLSVYLSSTGDTGHYTFQGTKLMARATFDPVELVFGTILDEHRDKDGSKVREIFGKDGLKFYGEIAAIGLKNYPASFELVPEVGGLTIPQNRWGYTKLSERMPWMLGVNIPTWRIFDVCAIEVERYPAPYPNDYYESGLMKCLPIPTFYDTLRSTPGYDSASYSGERWYWSIYLKKQVQKNLSFFSQISRDHTRWCVGTGRVYNYDSEEIMPKKGQWSWRAGMTFEF